MLEVRGDACECMEHANRLDRESLWTFHIHKMEWRVYCIYDEAIKGDEKERGLGDGDGSWLLSRCEPFLRGSFRAISVL